MITVGIIEPNPLFSRNYVEFFEALTEYNIAFCVSSFNDLDTTEFPQHFDAIVLETASGETNSTHVIKHLKNAWPFTPVILFTTRIEVLFLIECLKNGADSFILKSDGLFMLHHAIRETMKDGFVISPVATRLLIRHAFTNANAAAALNLTAKEKQIISLIKKGLSYKQMADELGVTPFTINHHLKRIYKKGGVKSRSQLMVLLDKYAES